MHWATFSDKKAYTLLEVENIILISLSFRICINAATIKCRKSAYQLFKRLLQETYDATKKNYNFLLVKQPKMDLSIRPFQMLENWSKIHALNVHFYLPSEKKDFIRS